MLGVPVVRGLVKKLSCFAGDDKAMGKARWHPQLALVVCRQFNAHPFAEVGRRATQIDCHVKHSALGHANQFALWILDLVMQATQHPLAGFAVVVLNEIHIQASRLLNVFLIEALKEEAAVITFSFKNWWTSPRFSS